MSADWLDEGKALWAKSENANTVPCVVPNEAPNGGTACMFVPPTDGYFVAWLWLNRHRLLAAAELAEEATAPERATAWQVFPEIYARALQRWEERLAAYRASKEGANEPR